MALEAVAMVYSNVLRDHVNKVSVSLLYLCILETRLYPMYTEPPSLPSIMFVTVMRPDQRICIYFYI